MKNLILRIFNPKQMAAALKREDVTNIEFATYTFIVISLTVYSIYLSWWNVHTTELFFFLDLLLEILGNILLVVITYSINKKGDDKRFWYRFICLSIPVGILTGLFMIILSILLSIFVTVDSTFDLIDLCILFSGLMFATFYLVKYMRIISK